MKERPILFSSPMVRAILDGSKTQTRRIVKPQPHTVCGDGKRAWSEGLYPGTFAYRDSDNGPNKYGQCPYGVPGDRLWVREAWACHWANDNLKPSEIEGEYWSVRYFADDFIRGCAIDGSKAMLDQCQKRRSSIFMPRWASRITLEIVSVRVERLQDISEEDAKAEGIATTCPCAGGCDQHRKDFCLLWESIHGLGSWGSNPWVWCIEFKRVEVSR